MISIIIVVICLQPKNKWIPLAVDIDTILRI